METVEHLLAEESSFYYMWGEMWLNWEGWWKSCRVAGRQTNLLCPRKDFCILLCQGQAQVRAGKPHLHPATSSLPPATQEHCAFCVALLPNIKPLAEMQYI